MYPIENDLKKAFHHILHEMSDEELLAAMDAADCGVLHKFDEPIFCETLVSMTVRVGFQINSAVAGKFPDFDWKSVRMAAADYNGDLALAA